MSILNFIGTWVPIVSFLAIFITFMASIIARYIFRTSIRWSYEISVLGYIWCMFFGVGKAIDTDAHVVFSLVYDKLKPFGQFFCKALYNIILILILLICFVPCTRSLLNSSMKTSVLHMPYSVVFAPFLYMLAEIMVRSGINIYRAYKEYKEGPPKEEETPPPEEPEKIEEGGAEA